MYTENDITIYEGKNYATANKIAEIANANHSSSGSALSRSATREHGHHGIKVHRIKHNNVWYYEMEDGVKLMRIVAASNRSATRTFASNNYIGSPKRSSVSAFANTYGLTEEAEAALAALAQTKSEEGAIKVGIYNNKRIYFMDDLITFKNILREEQPHLFIKSGVEATQKEVAVEQPETDVLRLFKKGDIVSAVVYCGRFPASLEQNQLYKVLHDEIDFNIQISQIEDKDTMQVVEDTITVPACFLKLVKEASPYSLEFDEEANSWFLFAENTCIAEFYDTEYGKKCLKLLLSEIK